MPVHFALVDLSGHLVLDIDFVFNLLTKPTALTTSKLVSRSQTAFFLLCVGGEKGSGTMTLEILFKLSSVLGER